MTDPDAPVLKIGDLEVYVNPDGSVFFHADDDLCDTVLSETPTVEEATALRDLLDQYVKRKAT